MKIQYSMFAVLLLVTGLIFITGCSEDSPAEPADNGGATISGTLTFPESAEGKLLWVIIDADLDGANGFVEYYEVTLGTGTTKAYSFGFIETGAYYIYSGVRVNSEQSALPATGDFIGFYGTNGTPPSSANATVPSAGSAKFDITLSTYTAP